MTVAVVIAYDGGRNPLRQGPFDQVHNHLTRLGWPIHVATDPHLPYRRALAVNRAAGNTNAEILLLNDADLICPLEQIRAAVELAAAEPGLVFAFDTYVRVNEPDGQEITLSDTAANGCVAIRRNDFLELGGYDEAFVGWGAEDREFNARAEKLRPLRRVPGRIEHLWHGDRRADDSTLDTPPEQVAANWAHYRSTVAA